MFRIIYVEQLGKFFFKEYVASLIGLYKNNGAVSCVGICTQLTYRIHPGVSHDVTFNLIPNRIGFCHGQILIEPATYSLSFSSHLTLPELNLYTSQGPYTPWLH